jgi:hypothetical protein
VTKCPAEFLSDSTEVDGSCHGRRMASNKKRERAFGYYEMTEETQIARVIQG